MDPGSGRTLASARTRPAGEAEARALEGAVGALGRGVQVAPPSAVAGKPVPTTVGPLVQQGLGGPVGVHEGGDATGRKGERKKGGKVLMQLGGLFSGKHGSRGKEAVGTPEAGAGEAGARGGSSGVSGGSMHFVVGLLRAHDATAAAMHQPKVGGGAPGRPPLSGGGCALCLPW